MNPGETPDRTCSAALADLDGDGKLDIVVSTRPDKKLVYRADATKETGEQSWNVIRFDKGSGKVLWEQTAWKGVQRTERHMKATQANTTLATDGSVPVGFFGSEGLYCYNHDGKLLWSKISARSMSASTAWVGATRVRRRCMATRRGISSRGGEGVERRGDLAGEARRCVRAMLVNAIRPRGGWPHAGGCQRPYVVSHDFHTGKELWRLKAGGDNPIPTPFTAHGYIYDANGHGAEAPV